MTLPLGIGGTQVLTLLKPGKLNDYACNDKDSISQKIQAKYKYTFIWASSMMIA